jgi:beta-galactosidase
MKLSQPVGLHKSSKISDLWAAPEFPQECSNRTDTRWFKISNGKGTNLTAQFYESSDKNQRHLFDFMASHYDVKDIFESKHPYELEEKKKEHVILRLDAEHHGLGTGSCGPKTLDEYALKTAPFEFGLVLY